MAWIIIDNSRSTLSARLIASCMESGTLIIFSDQRHHPCGLGLSFHQHHAQTEISRLQLGLSQPFKKQLWRHVVKCKITNQAENLKQLQHKNSHVLTSMAKRVRSGDPDNIEAAAARQYWQHFFDDFRRSDDDDFRNSLLNYGYACVRAALARALVAVGFLPSIGLHHDGRLNAFNLVDDIIEPYRPVVDWTAKEHLQKRSAPGDRLDLEDRQVMAAVLTRNVVMDQQQFSLLHATEQTADSLRRATERGDVDQLLFPKAW